MAELNKCDRDQAHKSEILSGSLKKFASPDLKKKIYNSCVASQNTLKHWDQQMGVHESPLGIVL